MMRLLLLLILAAGPATAETVVAARTIRPLAVLGPEDISIEPNDTPGALSDSGSVIGREARVAIYAGRPIRPDDIGAPAIVDRNQLVSITYSAGALQIRADGRALGRGGVGDEIRVMNLASRTTVIGRISPDGSVQVGPDF